ncbi:hypothetical protein [Pseudomonas sp. MNR3A]|uniref:hypothetical protein n=1 Tax=Pseudomonas sp. MNR3A TaxID=2615213 RepID=UPI00129B7E01|nr:hypothetical protein [Pseudomonas sp. MNR3A]
MSSDFDEGSFPKARGWLLAFSSLLIALWFFGADLKALSVLGTQIEFRRNTEHIWFVAFAINAYLLLRFYQQQPDVSYSGLKEYKGYYVGYLRNIMLWLNRQSIKKEVLERGKGAIISALKCGVGKCVIETSECKRFTDPSEKRRYIRGMKDVLVIHAYCVITNEKDGGVATTGTYQIDRDCPYWLICLCVWLSLIKLCIKTSYATEHLLPYIWSGFAAVICLLRWSAVIAS